jgi:hypothetical protein
VVLQGPQGLLGTATGATEWLRAAQAQAVATWPRLSVLLQKPSAQELAGQVSVMLAQRFAARTIKFVAGGWGGRQRHLGS